MGNWFVKVKTDRTPVRTTVPLFGVYDDNKHFVVGDSGNVYYKF
jgi:hypothetical protein